MSEIRVPQAFVADFEIVLSLGKDKLAKLQNLLGSSEIGLSPEKIAEKFHETVGVTQRELEIVVSVIYSVNRVKISSGHDTDNVADDFANALIKTGGKNLSREKCKEYLLEVLKFNDVVFLTVAMAESVSDRERLLQGVDILTDVRPIFRNGGLSGLTVIHTLKMVVRDSSGKSEIYLAIDKSDMDRLEKLIQRARENESLLKSNITGTFVELSQ